MSSGRLREVKNDGNNKTVRPIKWSQSPMRGGLLTRGAAYLLLTADVKQRKTKQ